MTVTFICCVSIPLNNPSGSMLTIACSVANVAALLLRAAVPGAAVLSC